MTATVFRSLTLLIASMLLVQCTSQSPRDSEKSFGSQEKEVKLDTTKERGIRGLGAIESFFRCLTIGSCRNITSMPLAM